MRSGVMVAMVAACVSASACGGGGSSSSPTTPSTPGAGGTASTFTITSSGVDPKEVTISAGERVTFVNRDSRSHDMSSDPHPDHTDCPETNQVGFLQPNQTKQTGNYVITPRTCGFHDHDQPTNNALKGRIIIR